MIVSVIICIHEIKHFSNLSLNKLTVKFVYGDFKNAISIYLLTAYFRDSFEAVSKLAMIYAFHRTQPVCGQLTLGFKKI